MEDKHSPGHSPQIIPRSFFDDLDSRASFPHLQQEAA